MKCKVCNAEILEGQAFCSYCGTKIENEPIQEVIADEPQQAVEVDAPAADQSVAQSPVEEAVYVQPAEIPEEQPDPADKNAIVGFILGLCSFVLCCIGLPTGIVGIILSAKGIRSKTKKGFAIPGLIFSILAVVNFFSFWIGFAEGLVEGLLEPEYISVLTQFLF